ncbi:MAG: hypothetical protein R2909_08200 [Gemmatimonadales bacterium]
MGLRRPAGAGPRRATQDLNPKELALPPGALQRIPPRPVTFSRHRELFPRTTGLVFDAVSPATVAADLTVGLLLDEQRASRLVIQHDLDQSLPSLDSVIDRLFAATFEARDGLALRGRAGSGRRSGWWWTG